MASTSKLITITLKLQDEMSKELDKSANSLKKIGDNLTSLGQKMTAGITLPIVAAGTAMFKTFADFESVIAELGARTGATAEEMKKMSDYALKMGRDTAFSATEAAQALLELTSSGASAAEAMEQLPHVLNLAAAGALELGEAADGLTDVMAAFQLEGEKAAYVADVLTKAAGASSATVQDLLDGFGNMGPVAEQFGISVADAAAAMAVLAENGIKGAEAGTQLKSMLLNMSKDTEPVAEAWSKLGLSMYDAQGNMKNIDDLFKEINKAMEDMTMEEQNRLAADLAGSYGLVGFNALRAANGTSEMRNAMHAAAGAEEVAEARMNTLAGKFDSMMGSIEGLGIVLGGLAQGPLLWLIEGVTNAVNAFSEWAAANPALAQTVMIILAIVAAIGPLLIIFGQIAGAIGAIMTIWPALVAAFSGFAGVVALIMSPLGLFVAAVAIAVAAILGNWFGLRDALVGSVGAIVGAVSQVGDAFKGVGGMVMQGWENVYHSVGTTLAQIAQIVGTTLGRLIVIAMKIGSDIMAGMLKGILSGAIDIIAAVLNISQQIQNAIKKSLGIASPSKVMMELGENTAQGFYEGLAGGGAGSFGVETPSMSGGRNLGTSLATAGAGAGMGGGGNQNFYITVAKGTPDEQVREIMQKIAKESRKKGATGK